MFWAAAGKPTKNREPTTCCYVRSNKAWVNDPSGVQWETFFTFGEATSYRENESTTSAACWAGPGCG